MKPRAVRGLDPAMPLDGAARRIVAVRVADLYACAPAALRRDDAAALHDLRIATKRLRYVLELVGFCLGDAGQAGLTAARELQTLTGDIHDCDVLLARIAAAPSANGKGMRRLAKRFRERRRDLYAQFTGLWQRIEAVDLRATLAATTSSSPGDRPASA